MKERNKYGMVYAKRRKKNGTTGNKAKESDFTDASGKSDPGSKRKTESLALFPVVPFFFLLLA